jgi:hypothetical protein
MDSEKIQSFKILSDKILAGIKLAVENLIISSAKNGESLVVKVDGKVTSVPAEDLLPSTKK